MKTEVLPKSLQRKVERVNWLALNGHTMGTIAQDTKLSFAQIERILKVSK